jgi:hypothetical protein
VFSEFRYRVKQWIGRHPSLYFPVFKNRVGYEDRLVGQKHDICIDGFPRSANSFAVGAFESVNPTAKVAHHAHVPAQLMRACEVGIPAIALIRDPVDTVISGHGLELQIADVENRPVGA